MGSLYNSKVIIDQKYFIVIADDSFLKYTGADMYASVEKMVYPEDIERLRRAIDELQIEGITENWVSIRIRNFEEQYIWVRMYVSYERKNDEGKESLYRLVISDRKGVETQEQPFQSLLQEYGIYLGLFDVVAIRYQVESHEIKVFRTSTDGVQYLFQGALEECMDKWLEKKVCETSKDSFLALQADLVEGKKSFQHRIELKNVIREGDQCSCTVRCHAIVDQEGKRCVLGGVELQNGQDTRPVIFEQSSDKDVALNMLNKRAIIEYARRVIERREEKRTFFIIVDLDNFKLVNDIYGHMAGDEVLVKITEIINEGVGNRGKVGRIGGDEFLIVTSGISEQTELRNMLRTIRTNVEWSYKDKMEGISLTCSMGVSAFPDNAESYEEIFSIADKMLYLAKEKGRNRYVIYTPEIHGNYVFGETKQVEIIKPESPCDRTGVMQYMLENYLIQRISSNDKLFGKVGPAYNLCEILIIYHDFTVAYQWTPQGVCSNINEIVWMKPDSIRLEAFNENKLFIADNSYEFDKETPEIKEILEKKDIQAAIFYKLEKKGKFSGYVMFGKNVRRQKWSEAEVIGLATVAKVFEMAIIE